MRSARPTALRADSTCVFRSALLKCVRSRGSSTFSKAVNNGNEIIKLKYQSNMTRSPRGNFAFVHGGDFFAPDRHAPGSRVINPGDQIQQCRLAGTRWPHDRHERFAGNVEGHIIQRAHLEFIALVGTSHMRQLHCAVSIIVFRLCHKSLTSVDWVTFRELATTLKPRSTNACTIPAPIPCEVPVTMAVFCGPLMVAYLRSCGSSKQSVPTRWSVSVSTFQSSSSKSTQESDPWRSATG